MGLTSGGFCYVTKRRLFLRALAEQCVNKPTVVTSPLLAWLWHVRARVYSSGRYRSTRRRWRHTQTHRLSRALVPCGDVTSTRALIFAQMSRPLTRVTSSTYRLWLESVRGDVIRETHTCARALGREWETPLLCGGIWMFKTTAAVFAGYSKPRFSPFFPAENYWK